MDLHILKYTFMLPAKWNPFKLTTQASQFFLTVLIVGEGNACDGHMGKVFQVEADGWGKMIDMNELVFLKELG